MRAVPSRRLPPGKRGTPPCKSGQLEKDLGLEVSSARHAARLIIFEIMRLVLFRWFEVFQSRMEPEPSLTRRMDEMRPHFGDSGLQLDLEIA
jgi:hypothetical protein